MDIENINVFFFGVSEYLFLENRGSKHDFDALKFILQQRFKYNFKSKINNEISRQDDIFTLFKKNLSSIKNTDNILIMFSGLSINLNRDRKLKTYLGLPISRNGSKKGSLSIEEFIINIGNFFPKNNVLVILDIEGNIGTLDLSIIKPNIQILTICSENPISRTQYKDTAYNFTTGLIMDFLSKIFYLGIDSTSVDLFNYLNLQIEEENHRIKTSLINKNNFSLNLFNQGKYPDSISDSIQAGHSSGAREDGVIRLGDLINDNNQQLSEYAHQTLFYLSQNDSNDKIRTAALRQLGKNNCQSNVNIQDFETTLNKTQNECFFPELIEIPKSYFIMGSNNPLVPSEENPEHKLLLDNFSISKTPITNYQYLHFVSEENYTIPFHWKNQGELLKILDHPVVYVSWYDTLNYCDWLTKKLKKIEKISHNQVVMLPSEAQWEKSARGLHGQTYPWGNIFQENMCNYGGNNKSGTTSVYAYPESKSPYGVLDLVGNCWEWTRSLWGMSLNKCHFTYPYNPKDGRENQNSTQNCRRIIRGGGYYYSSDCVTGYTRNHFRPSEVHSGGGFRIIVEIKD